MRTAQEAIQYVDNNFTIKKFNSPIGDYFTPWMKELDEEFEEQQHKVKRILKTLLNSTRIFTVGKGRSESMAGATGMRFMHAGYEVYEVGHKYTPAIGNDSKYKDCVLGISGSGETPLVVTTSKIAKKNDVPVTGISSNENSQFVKIAGKDNIIITKGKKIYPKDQVPSEHEQAINFLQTKSEIKALIGGEMFLNSVAEAKGITEDYMKRRHANV